MSGWTVGPPRHQAFTARHALRGAFMRFANRDTISISGAVLRYRRDEAEIMPFRSPWSTSRIDQFATGNADLLILIGRVLLAWVFVGSAYGALTNFSGSVSYFRSLNLPVPQGARRRRRVTRSRV